MLTPTNIRPRSALRFSEKGGESEMKVSKHESVTFYCGKQVGIRNGMKGNKAVL